MVFPGGFLKPFSVGERLLANADFELTFLTKINLVAPHAVSGMDAVLSATSTGIIHRPLDQSARSKHDAARSRGMIRRGETSMFERALPLPHREIAHGERPAAHRPPSASPVVHDVAARLLRMLRAIGAFFAAGGALS
jgi:hypothetical protein